MASKKKESEGIALLSMYNDEDDEMEDLEEEDEQEQEQQQEQDDDFKYSSNADEDSKKNDDMVLSDSANDNTTGIANDNTTSQSPLAGGEAQAPAFEFQRSRRRRPTIVDYGHDEAAMSPEAEEGELGSSGRVMFGVELQTANGDFLERTPPATVQVSTPGVQATPQSSERQEPSQYDTMNYAVSESEAAEIEEEPRNVGLLDKFLPQPPKVKCVEDLQKKINKFLAFKRAGKSFNAEVRNRKDYRNPDFLLHAVRYQDIDQIGSCFSKDVFDPHGYEKSDYFDEIEADMKREMERKEQERKRSPKVEFVSGGTQPVTVAAAKKVNLPISGVSTVASSGQHSAPTAADSVARDGRQNKKSKWDKVDGDRRNHLPTGGQDSVSAVGAHAALLSAANAGAGYTAFAQQRRREAEEKRSSERKLERRS